MSSDSQLVARRSNFICNLLDFSKLQSHSGDISIFSSSRTIPKSRANFLYKKFIPASFRAYWAVSIYRLSPCGEAFGGGEACGGEYQKHLPFLLLIVSRSEPICHGRLPAERQWESRTRRQLISSRRRRKFCSCSDFLLSLFSWAKPFAVYAGRLTAESVSQIIAVESRLLVLRSVICQTV